MSDKWLVTLCCRCCPLRPHCCKIKIWQCFAESSNSNLFLSVSSISNIANYVWVVRKPRKRHHASDICRPIALLRTTHLFLCCAHFCAYNAHFCSDFINHLILSLNWSSKVRWEMRGQSAFRDVTAGVTGATAVVPKFSDKYFNPIQGFAWSWYVDQTCNLQAEFVCLDWADKM